MDKQRTAFFCVIAMMGLSALIFTSQMARDYWRFFHLSAQAEVKAISLTPLKLNRDHYVLHARYSYLTYEKEEVLSDPSYLNAYAAEGAAEKRLREFKSVWYDPSDPSFSSLERKISYKQVAYTFILWGLTAYFYFLHLWTRS